jgi:hypothetical protein
MAFFRETAYRFWSAAYNWLGAAECAGVPGTGLVRRFVCRRMATCIDWSE